MAEIIYEWSSSMRREAHISDPRLLAVVQRIADLFGDVTVISGDRDFVPPGGAPESLHLLKEAADIKVKDMSPEILFEHLIQQRLVLFGPETGDDFRWQIILHGVGTHTEGHHIHLSYVPAEHKFHNSTPLRGYVVEGGYKGKFYPRYTPLVLP